MKKLIDKLGTETVFGGLFGVITLAAILAEMSIAGFDAASVAGGIKDIFSTLITVVMLVVAVSALKPRKKKDADFQTVFTEEMEKIMKKYEPMVTFYGKEESKTYEGFSRYNIANKLDCVTTNNPGGNNKFFRIKEGMQNIEFSVSGTVFKDRKENVKARIAPKLQKCYKDQIASYKITDAGFVLTCQKPLTTGEDARNFARIIDHMLILYIAEEKKA